MTLKYNLCVARKGKDEKTYWDKIGVVLEGDKGMKIHVDLIPVGWNGWAEMFEPKNDKPSF